MNPKFSSDTSYKKSLEMLPNFTIKQIEQDILLRDKNSESAIIKVLEKVNYTFFPTVFQQIVVKVYCMSKDYLKPV